MELKEILAFYHAATMQSFARADSGTIGDVFAGVLPFVLLYIGAIGVLMALPQIALWLPRVLS